MTLRDQSLMPFPSNLVTYSQDVLSPSKIEVNPLPSLTGLTGYGRKL